MLTPSKELTIATRGSKLALWQAQHIRDRLIAAEPELVVHLLVLKTVGDRVLDRPLSEVGGKGLFTKEIEEALLDGRAQVAVHSMKDLPAGPDDTGELVLGAVPERADPRDALLVRPELRAALAALPPGELPLSVLPHGARVGTSSLRRHLLLRSLRPDLQVEALRGNVDTRLRRLDAGELDAILLAVAGLSRLGYGPRIDAALPLTLSLPAVGQGALAVQCRGDDEATRRRLSVLDHADTHDAIRGERAFLAGLEGNCRTPLAAHAQLRGDEVALEGWLATDETSANPVLHRGERRGPRVQSAALGASLAAELKQRAHQ